MRSQKPELRITKWLRRIQSAGQQIPLEAECAACADAQFKIKHDKRREWTNIFGGIGMHNPDRNNCMHILEELFAEHLKLVHPDEDETQSNPPRPVNE